MEQQLLPTCCAAGEPAGLCCKQAAARSPSVAALPSCGRLSSVVVFLFYQLFVVEPIYLSVCYTAAVESVVAASLSLVCGFAGSLDDGTVS